jgi:hypothetical protein
MNAQKINFNQIIDALLDDDAQFPIDYIMVLSDITPANLEILRRAWGQISPVRKALLMENIEVFHVSEITSNFEDIASLAIEDMNTAVRMSGLRLFYDYENSSFVNKFIELLETDPDIGVRSQAAITLGKYMYLAELEMIDERHRNSIDEALIKVLRSDENELVRQKALEAFGYSSRREVKDFIHTAFNSGDYNWIASSLVAMGRSADEAYATQILTMLVHPEIRIQREAVYAAGELELTAAKNLLLKLAMELEAEEELWLETITALSKIGGEGVSEVFEKLLENASTDEEEEFLNDAIENLNLTNDMAIGFNMMDLKEPVDGSLREFDLEDDDFDLDDYSKSWIDELEENLESKYGDEFEDFDDDDLDDEEDEF